MRSLGLLVALSISGCAVTGQQAQIDSLTDQVQELRENEAALEEEVMAIYTMLGASSKPGIEKSTCEASDSI